MKSGIARAFVPMLFVLLLLVERSAAAVALPDLTVSALSAPATGGAGSTITVTDTTRNAGAGPAAASVTRFYVSSDKTWDAGDVPIGYRDVPNLAPGASSPGSTVLTIPSGYPPGTSYVIAKADADGALPEANEANNTRSDAIVIGPDLIVSALSAPSTTGAGLSIVVTDTSKNQGGGSAPPFATAFYLSANSTLGAGDVLLGSRTLTAGLGPNASSSGSTTLTIPASTAPASYYLVAKADDGGAVAETIETNNTKVVLIRISPDLQVSALSAPASAAPGAGISVSDTTRNAGQGTAGASTTRIYLSLNTTFEAAADTPLGFRAVPMLITGATSPGSTPVTIPAGTTPGTWYIVARADADNAVAESHETNNLAYRAITVTAPPDTTGPSVPAGLTASAASCSQINLAWAASTDNPGGSGIKGYNVYKNGVFLKQVLVPATSTSDSGLAASTAFSYTVSAVDNASNESMRSTAAGATTPACTTQAVWADRFGNTQEDRGRSVAIDPSGNTILTGHFRQTADFGGGPLTAHLYCLLGTCLPGTPSDIFLAKFTPTGDHLWSKNIGGHSDDSGSAVAVDSAGDVLVTGQVGPNVDFGAGELPSLSGYDFFVAKYSGPDGSYRWARRLGSEGNDVFSNAMAVDSLGDVVVVGKFMGTVDFGRGPLTSAGDWDIFVAKYSGVDGTALWSKRLGGAAINNGLGVAVDSHGDVVVTGFFNGVADFGGPAPLTSADAFHADIFLAKYRASDGAWLWTRQIGGTSNDNGNAVAVDSADNILLTGYFIGTVNFGGPTSLSSANPAGSEAFVAKYTASGGYIWAQRLGGVSFTGTSGTALVVDGSDNVAVTGKFQGTVDFGNGPLTSAGGNDIFVAKFPPSGGTALWSKRFGGLESTDGDYEKSFGLAAGPDGSTIVTGYFIGTTAFGADTYTSFGYGDIFLLHIGP